MNNAQQIDLHDVESYWKSRSLVDDRHLPYDIRWLQHFLASIGADLRLGPNDARLVFADRLRADWVPEWQVEQALRAVELYQKHYLCFRDEQGGATPADPASTAESSQPGTWDSAIHETRRLIRLRHYSYRTEQTYLGWLSRHWTFVGRRQLAWNAIDSFRAFLGETAMRHNVSASTQNQAFSALLFDLCG